MARDYRMDPSLQWYRLPFSWPPIDEKRMAAFQGQKEIEILQETEISASKTSFNDGSVEMLTRWVAIGVPLDVLPKYRPERPRSTPAILICGMVPPRIGR